MKYRHIINPVELAKKIMDMYIEEGMTVCDCTLGNGNDSLYLSRLIGSKGTLYGFDIQELALRNTKELLLKNEYRGKLHLFLSGHESIDEYITEALDFVIFNLGYLPKGDKSLKTKASTSVSAIDKSLKLLKNNGILLVTCYTGHEGGLEEKTGVESFLSSLNQREYNVLEFNFKNQMNCPPILYGVEKK